MEILLCCLRRVYIYANHTIEIHKRIQADTNTQATPLFRYESFINIWLRFFDTRRETQFFKSLSYHTMLTTSFNGRNPTLCPNARNSTIVFHGPTSNPNCLVGPELLNNMVGPQLLTIMVGPQLQLSAIEADNPTCLPTSSNSQLPIDPFSKSSNS